MKSTDNYARIEKAIQYLKVNCLSQPSLDEVARHVGLSKFHFQRIFQTWAGVSPKSFTQYLTIEHAKNLLAKGQSTLQTSYDSGLSGTGRLHNLFVKIESVSPGEYKNQGKGICISYQFLNSLFGNVLIAQTQKGICHLSFIVNKEKAVKELKSFWKNARFIQDKTPQMKVVELFLDKSCVPDKKILLDLQGTDFQIKVWEALLKIPKGQLASYNDIARYIGHPKASRAVGSAIARNPIAYLIPCHRVIQSGGFIGQYRWGSTRKATLIGWESA